MHIAGERSCWGDLLSRWVKVLRAKIRSIAVFAGSQPDDTMPSKEVIREAQLEARERMGAFVGGDGALKTPVGHAQLDDEGLHRVSFRDRRVL